MVEGFVLMLWICVGFSGIGVLMCAKDGGYLCY